MKEFEKHPGFAGSKKGICRMAGIRLKPWPKSLKRRRKIRRHNTREFFKVKEPAPFTSVDVVKDSNTGLSFQTTTELDKGKKVMRVTVTTLFGIGTHNGNLCFFKQ